MSDDEDAVARIVAQWRQVKPELETDPMLVIGRIGRLAATIDARLRPTFAEIGLGNGDFDVLAALRRSGEPPALSPGDLAEAMIVTTGAVTKRVDRLADKGLVTREVAPDDARGRVVSLTPAGLELVDQMMVVHLANERRLLQGLSGEQVDQLAGLLRVLAASLESESLESESLESEPPGA
jgi:DNA-binding MarR family transcriptional regulator